MNYKFHPFERAVGIFLMTTMVGSLSTLAGIAVKKNWFDERIHFATHVASATNIRVGSSVLINGLKVGSIDEVELDPNQEIKVTFSIFKKYRRHITAGSHVKFSRHFLVGEKILSITQGKAQGPLIAAGSVLPSEKVMDIAELLDGQKFQDMMGKLDGILNNIDATVALGKGIAAQVNEKQSIRKTLDNIAYSSAEVRKMLPHVVERAPLITKNLNTIMENLQAVTAGLKAASTNLPEGGAKTMDLINESIIVVRAMQKSFFLRGSVEEVKTETAEREKAEVHRRPASAQE